MSLPRNLPFDPDAPGRIVTTENVHAHGLTYSDIRSGFRQGGLQRRYRGVYEISAGDPNSPDAVEQRLRAAHAHLGPESVFILTSALWLHGISGVVGQGVPQLAMPPGMEKHQRDGVEIHFWTLPEEQRVDVNGLPVTSVLRTVADAVRLLPRLQAVSCVDSALNLGLLRPPQFADIFALMRRQRHCVAGRTRLAEARVDAQSPLETRVRLRATDGGYPPDALQVPITSTQGIVLGYGDLGYRLADGTWLVVEADGRSVHELPEALLHDRRRQNAFAGHAGVTIIRFTWADTISPDTIPAVLGPALARGGWRTARRP